MLEIKSITIMPVNGLSAVYEEDESYWKTPVLAIACVHVVEEEGGHSINLLPIKMDDIVEGYVLLDKEGFTSKESNFRGLLNENVYTKDLTVEELKLMGISVKQAE